MFFKNYLSTLLTIVVTVIFYQTVPYYISFFDKTFVIMPRDMSFHTDRLFVSVVTLYAIGLALYYSRYDSPSSSWYVRSYLRSQCTSHPQSQSRDIKQHILKLAVKFFFAPLMIFWLTDHCVTLINNSYAMGMDLSMMWSDFFSFFQKHLFWNLFSMILLLDVFFFTVGYLTERDLLDNEIRSVQPYAIWWIVALLCYPPFNTVTSGIFQRYSTDFPQFDSPSVTIIAWMMICILMGIYTRASVSLWWKASNLTNRGIVCKGPYAYVRHPAYVSKNMARTVGALPVIFTLIWSQQWRWLVGVVSSLLAWRALYYARAMTEEMHLAQDPDYIAYRKKVKYKYVPGLF